MENMSAESVLIALLGTVAGIVITYMVNRFLNSGDKAQDQVDKHRKEWENSVDEMFKEIKLSLGNILQSTTIGNEQRKTIFSKIQENKADIEKTNQRITEMQNGLVANIMKELSTSIKKP